MSGVFSTSRWQAASARMGSARSHLLGAGIGTFLPRRRPPSGRRALCAFEVGAGDSAVLTDTLREPLLHRVALDELLLLDLPFAVWAVDQGIELVLVG